ncbi:MAG TPA: phosphoribosylaminoimidazolesuccinocarboxamide synthase [Gammaproteobacteria bacterium]|nr:phosphoribosylaminoimidazolesuccinocarboxamide synthase [Gammaproteobacteria bacterium]
MTATIIKDYSYQIRQALNFRLDETQLSRGKKYQGKVRDTYDLGDKLILITTDRLSAFDRNLVSVPYKGQVLNLTSAWWFEQTKHIVANHVLAIPDPNVTLAKKCKVFPIEFVVRGYITGTTSTSLWTQYNKGVRHYCGLQLQEGLRKNQKLDQAVITPTTKDTHDRPISPHEIIKDGFMSATDWEQASAIALHLYNFGTELAAKHGLILVDTKYELGKDEEGNIILVDEIHTPDSSRYWLAHSYAERFAQQQEPENIDKEFLRLWFAKNCDPYKDTVLPQAPEELIVTLSARYIQLYEMITGQDFQFPELLNFSLQNRIADNIEACLA